MRDGNVSRSPSVLEETSLWKGRWGFFRPPLGVTITAALFMISATLDFAQADLLRLVEREEGNEVEVLEEQQDTFLVKVPKSEVKLIKRETPTEVKFWREKKILWKDQGDYLVISLPKERILPPRAETGESSAYATASTLQEGLDTTGAKGQTSAVGMLAGTVTGRVLQGDLPLAGCRVRISAIEGPTTQFTRLLDIKSGKEPAPAKMATTTGSNGVYLFEEVQIGEYDISWLPSESKHWLGVLSDKPDVTVRAGETSQQGDIHV